MIILGLNAYHGDAAAVLLRDGVLVAAVEEERPRRLKHCAGFPSEAIRLCLEIAGIAGNDVDHVALSRDPRANRTRRALFALRRPAARLVKARLTTSARLRGTADLIAQSLGSTTSARPRLHQVEHHPAHLASAFLVSPFERAAVCAVDGFGDFVSTSLALGQGTRIDVLDRVYFPHSLGLFYLALTQYLGFPRYGDEYKVMGLAPYGEPDFVEPLRRVVRLGPDGGFELDLSFFRHSSDGVSMTRELGEPHIGPVFTAKLEALLGPARAPDDPIEPRHEAIAASLQAVFEDAVFHVLRALHRRTGVERLCLAGGCAMNSVANGKIRERTPFRDVYVQPAAADNGTALGAAFHVWTQVLGRARDFVMSHAYWGPEFGRDQVSAALVARRDELDATRCRRREMAGDDELAEWTAGQLAEGRIVGWFQGRMEWGARALGNRSILADPRRADMRDVINARIKLREKFRPFAPSILEEAVDEYFAGAVPDPFMIQVYPIRPEKRRLIPAVTHVDGTGRIHSVSRDANPLYRQLLEAFEKRTGVPVLLNTSFNENEPIVMRPDEALDCFLRTRMDVLVLGRTVLVRGTEA